MAKLSKKDLKEDHFGEILEEVWRYAKAHLEVVGGGALAVVILILAAVLFFQNQAKSEDEAVLLLDNARGAFLQAASPQDLQNAISQFENLSKRFGSTSSGRQALLYLGLSYRRVAAYDKAIPYLRNFVSKREKNDLLRAAGEEALAACYEDKGDLREAAKLFDRMAGDFAKNPLTASRALLSAGRCYEDLKDYASARQRYQKVIDRYPDSARSYDAKVALAMMPTG